MNPTIIKIAQFFAKRPKDSTIKLLHIITGLAIIAGLWYARDTAVMDIPFVGTYSGPGAHEIEYIFMIIGALFVLRGILPWCIIRHKTLKILQMLAGLALIIIGGPIMDPMIKNIVTQPTTPSSSEGFQIDTTVAPIVEMTWHPGTILILLGIFWIFMGLTGKATTSKCIRYGETVKKIRV